MKLLKSLEEQLKKISDYISENGELKKWVIINKAQNFDEELIGLLLGNKELKSKFFIKVKDALVFNQSLFIQFLEQKNYLNDSYTSYKKKIGLNIDGKYLSQRNEVTLVWPYKDCVLEGGQSREEDKREEIFFNETLAQDEITQLFEPKVLTNAKRYSAKGDKPLDKFTRDVEVNRKRGLPEDTITDNLIIKGNNLLALHSLKEEFAGKVKLIYIDPPYNTGGDSFKYNDSFNHSTWLTFMKNRLEVAKKLLMPLGLFWISVNDIEAHYLKIVCDDVFDREHFVADVIWNSTKSVTNTAVISDAHTHNLLYSANIKLLKENRVKFRLAADESKFSNNDNDPRGKWIADPFQVGGIRKNQLYEIRNPKTGKVYRPNPGCSWKNEKEVFDKLLKENRIVFGVAGEAGPQRKRFWSEAKERGQVTTTLWKDLPTTTNGTQHLKSLFSNKVFENPKPEGLIERIIQLSTDEYDIVLDFHLGSATTISAAHKMNRQYIGIEQMDYIEDVTIERMKKVMKGEQGGISESVNWKGGGEFVYFELKKFNEAFIEKIEAAKDTKTLLKIWEEMKQRSFLNYNVDIKKQEESIEEFQKLSLKEQKKLLAELLDKNQLYVNLSSMDDKDFKVTEEEKKVTRDFYKMKK